MISRIFSELKDFFGKDNEFVESVDLALKERVNSPFYGYFIVSWLIINWKVLYIAFFVSQDNIFEKTKLLRHEYLVLIFPSYLNINHWLNFLIYPFLLTILFFWVFPFVTRFFFKKSLRNEKILKAIELKESIANKKEEKKLIQQETQIIKEKSVQEKEKKRVEKITPELIWENDFEEFKKHKDFSKLQQIVDTVYQHSGAIKRWVGNARLKNIDTDMLAVAHTKNLISISGEQIHLTEKGKFFINKYLELVK